jgi:hypothetical protein
MQFAASSPGHWPSSAGRELSMQLRTAALLVAAAGLGEALKSIPLSHDLIRPGFVSR